ncbi:MAG: hypothetical protein WCA11_16185 [Terracidiphilus sp.]
MHRAAAIALALLLSPSLSIAQNAANSPTQSVFVLPPVLYTCPIGMRAEHAPDIHRVYVQGDTRTESSAMQLKFILTNRRPGQIVAANITAHGRKGKAEIIPAVASRASGDSADTAKTMDVSFASGADESVNTNIVLPGFSYVTFIELNSVTYANGTTWKFAPRDDCQVAPDPLMLIDAHMAPAPPH